MSSFEIIGERINQYRDELDKWLREFDPYAIAVTRGLMVANSDNQRKAAHELRGKYITGAGADEWAKFKLSRSARRSARWKERRDPTDFAARSWETQEEMGERVQKLYDLGVHSIYAVLSGSSEALQQFAEEVMPAYRRV